MTLRIFIVWYLMGLLLFYTAATFYVHEYNNWGYFYYLWAKGSDVLLIVTVLMRPRNSRDILPALIVAAARFLWEIVAWIIGLQSTNPVLVGSLFITLIFVCLLITIKEIINWPKRNF